MSALDVLPLEVAKEYLNITSDRQDDELTGFIPAAVLRVVRHTGHNLDTAADASPLELLACKVVLADFWRTQRVAAPGRGGYGGGSSGAAIEADSGIGGEAPLRVKLTELLGPPAATGDVRPEPVGCFPQPQPWPDPPFAVRYLEEPW